MTTLLVIRAAQLRALSRPMNDRFAHALAAHAQRWFPDDCRQLGDATLLALCHAAIECAGRHAITAENDTCKLLNLMFVFGADFDTRFTWAAEQLAAPGVGPVLRMNRLYITAQRRGHEATGLFGPDGATGS